MTSYDAKASSKVVLNLSYDNDFYNIQLAFLILIILLEP